MGNKKVWGYGLHFFLVSLSLTEGIFDPHLLFNQPTEFDWAKLNVPDIPIDEGAITEGLARLVDELTDPDCEHPNAAEKLFGLMAKRITTDQRSSNAFSISVLPQHEGRQTDHRDLSQNHPQFVGPPYNQSQ